MSLLSPSLLLWWWYIMKRLWNLLTFGAVVLSFVLTNLALSSCGGSLYQVKTSKDFRLTVRSDDSRVVSTINALVGTFNSKAGIEAISLAETPEDANSIILFTRGLTSRDGKVGWGQWLVETHDESAAVALTGRKPVREMEYSLRVELDEEYVTQRAVNPTTEGSYELFKLFAHEVGHGFQLEHNPNDESDMMYPDIGGTKDEARFFQEVRDFFAR